MRRITIAFLLIVSIVGPAAAAENTQVLAPGHQFVDGLNKGDVNSVVGACADETSLIDEFPPYEWHGAGACAKWFSDLAAVRKATAVTSLAVRLQKPLHVEVTGDRAYVVHLANLSYTMKGKSEKEPGAITFALQKGAAGWRITGFAWSAH
jgi:ketosteroid isomerase-like protein